MDSILEIKEGRTTKKDVVLIKILVITIVVLSLTLGYAMYSSLKTKSEIKELGYGISTLNEKKHKLAIEKEALERGIEILESEKRELVKEHNGLLAEKVEWTIGTSSIQKEYKKMSEELNQTKEELENCLNSK